MRLAIISGFKLFQCIDRDLAKIKLDIKSYWFSLAFGTTAVYGCARSEAIVPTQTKNEKEKKLKLHCIFNFIVIHSFSKRYSNNNNNNNNTVREMCEKNSVE